MIFLALFVALASGQQTTTRSVNAEGKTVITHHRVIDVEPQWISEPTREDYDREYPVVARQEGSNGRVIVECTAAEDGTLADCNVVSESPEQEGFGPATLRLITKYRMAPTDAKGHPVKGFRARLTIVWALLG